MKGEIHAKAFAPAPHNADKVVGVGPLLQFADAHLYGYSLASINGVLSIVEVSQRLGGKPATARAWLGRTMSESELAEHAFDYLMNTHPTWEGKASDAIARETLHKAVGESIAAEHPLIVDGSEVTALGFELDGRTFAQCIIGGRRFTLASAGPLTEQTLELFEH